MRKLDKTVLVKLLDLQKQTRKFSEPPDKNVKLVIKGRKFDWYETSQEQYKK